MQTLCPDQGNRRVFRRSEFVRKSGGLKWRGKADWKLAAAPLMGAAALMPLWTHAGEPEAPSPGAAESGSETTASPVAPCFGQVWHVAGAVEAVSEARGTRTLHQGDAVYVGERIRTNSTSEAVVQTTDAGIVAVRPNAEVVSAAYAADGRGTDHMNLRLLKGALRLVSGWIANTNRAGVEINTPTATMGIRGTDHEPYVLSEDVAESTPYDAGSYDKVNRGSTVLKTSTGEVEIKEGQVGFAPPPPLASNEPPNRALITLLLPRLLDRVPDFYSGGRFESEIAEYSRGAEGRNRTQLDEVRQASASGGRQEPCGRLQAVAQPEAAKSVDPAKVARQWIAHLDAAVTEHNPHRVLVLFARNAIIDARVLDASGKAASTHFTRKQFANSVRASLQGLEDYRQRRDTLDAHSDSSGEAGRSRVLVKSHVTEQGKLNGRDYRVESDEEYLLEQQGTRWLAVRASTTQR